MSRNCLQLVACAIVMYDVGPVWCALLAEGHLGFSVDECRCVGGMVACDSRQLVYA